jgi:hypothetical protein
VIAKFVVLFQLLLTGIKTGYKVSTTRLVTASLKVRK